MQKLRLLVALLAIMAVVVSMSLVSPATASYHNPPGYDGEYPPGHYGHEYGDDWQVDEVTDWDYDEDTGTWEYEVVGEFEGYPAEFELVCYDDRYSPYDEEFSPYDGGYSRFDNESCTPTDVELL